MLGKEEKAAQDQAYLDLYHKVHHQVCRYLSPEYDREFVTSGIILEAWRKHQTTVPTIHIRHRCSNAYYRHQRDLRRIESAMVAKREHNFKEESVDYTGCDHGQTDSPAENTVDRQQLVGLLVQVLTPTERKVIHMKFYLGKTLEEMVAATNLQREEIQKVIRIALYKMRQEIE